MAKKAKVYLSRVVLALSLVGILIGVFWDEFLEQIQHFHPSDGDADECPFVQLSGETPQSDSNPKKSHQNAPSFDNLPDIEELLPTKPLIELRTDEIRAYSGKNTDLPLLLAFDGYIFDTTSSSKVYGPKGAYSALTGNIATRAIGLSSLKPEDMNDDVHDFTKEQHETLLNWKRYYLNKYPVVGIAAYSDDTKGRVNKINSILSQGKRTLTLESMIQQLEMMIAKESLPTNLQLESIGGSNLVYNTYVFDVSDLGWLYGENGVRKHHAGTDITGNTLQLENVDGPGQFDATSAKLLHAWNLSYFKENCKLVGKLQ